MLVSIGLLLVSGLCSCASHPLETPELLDLASQRPTARSIAISVSSDGSVGFGDSDDWSTDFIHVFRDLNVCASVWSTTNRRAEDADVHLSVALRRVAPEDPRARDPEVDSQDVTVGVISWMFVPLLPIWLANVRVDPRVEARVRWSLDSAGGDSRGGDELLEPVMIETSLWERRPWLSWSMLGALIAPPVLFTGTDEERLQESIAKRVRLNVAAQVAASIKQQPLVERELLAGLDLLAGPSGITLRYRSTPEFGRLFVWLDGSQTKGDAVDLEFSDEPVVEGGVPLNRHLRRTPHAGDILRIEALRRDGTAFRYTIRVDSDVIAGQPVASVTGN